MPTPKKPWPKKVRPGTEVLVKIPATVLPSPHLSNDEAEDVSDPRILKDGEWYVWIHIPGVGSGYVPAAYIDMIINTPKTPKKDEA